MHLAREVFERTVKRDVEARVREGVKATLEEVLEEKMTEHLVGAGWLPRAHAHPPRQAQRLLRP